MFGVRAAIATIVLLCALGAGVVYFVLQGKNDPYRSVKVSEYAAPAEILVNYTLRDGAHIYSGVLPLPSVCNILSSGISASGTTTTHVGISLVVLEPKLPCSEEGEVFDQEFIVSVVSGNKGTPVFDGVTVNSKAVAYRLVELP